MQAPPQLMGSDLGNPPHGKDSAFATDTNQKAIWETDDISARILAIIFDYALDKFDDSRERLALDRDTWAYGEALRALAVKKGFNQIIFSRLKDLAGLELPQKLSEIVYVANATNFRRYLLNKYGKEDYDIKYEIATDPDTLMTYCGYKRFLESDLQHIFPSGENRSHNGYRRDVKYLAKEMIIRGCRALAKFSNDHDQGAWNVMVSSMKAVAFLNQGQLISHELLERFQDIANGEENIWLALFVTQQNSAVLVHRNDIEETVIFEAFQTEAPVKDVLAAKHCLTWEFPHRSVQVPFKVFNDMSFLRNLSQFLGQASYESFDQFAAKASKGGKSIAETRNSTDPALVVDMLMSLLEGLGSGTQVQSVRKKVRDDVVLGTSEVPWRRSPYWLVLRIALRRMLRELLDHKCAGMGRVYYKFIICAMLAELLKDSVDNLHPEMTLQLRAKLCRRMAKLKTDSKACSPSLSPLYNQLFALVSADFGDIVKHATDRVSLQWDDFKARVTRRIPTLPCRVPEADLYIRLDNSGAFLKTQLSQKFSPTSRITSPDLPKLQEGTVLEVGRLADRYISLQNCENAAATRIATTSDNPQELCKSLSAGIMDLLTNVGDSFNNDSTLMSRHLLRLFELWIKMDEAATSTCPLLKEYHPLFIPDALDVLCLMTRDEMERLLRVQQYIRNRAASHKRGLGTIFDNPRQGSTFPARYVSSTAAGSQMLMTATLIDDASLRARQSTLSELQRLTQSYDSLTQSLNDLTCTCTVSSTGKMITHGCRRCPRFWQRKKLKISVHEEFLPSTDSDQHNAQRAAILLELLIPKYLSAYRTATWQLYLLGTTVSSSTKAVPKLLLGDIHNIKKFSLVVNKTFTLASRKKSFRQTHYSKLKLPKMPDQVTFPFGAEMSYYDTVSGLWADELPKIPWYQHLLGPWLPQGIPDPYETPRGVLGTLLHHPSSYEIIASDSMRPLSISGNELSAFQRAISARGRRWLEILKEMAGSNFDFSSRDTNLFFHRLAMQAGPATLEEGIMREVHWVFNCEGFCSRLRERLEAWMDAMEQNWRQVDRMSTVVVLTLRLYHLCPPSFAPQAHELLLRVRSITSNWILELQHEVRSAPDGAMASKAATFAFWAALLCRQTFWGCLGRDELEATVLKDDPLPFFRSSIAIQENLLDNSDRLPPHLRSLLTQDMSTSYQMRRIVEKWVDSDIELVEKAIDETWANASVVAKRSYSPWKKLTGKHSWWISSETSPTGSIAPQRVHYHILQGHLLVDQKPLGRLPLEIRDDESMRELFEERQLLTRPSGLLDYQILTEMEGHQVHVGIRDRKLTIKALFRGSILQFVPRSMLKGPMAWDLPADLVDDCVHWLDLTTGNLEMRRKPRIWRRKLSNWILDIRKRRATRNTGAGLVEPNSEIGRKVGAIFQDFEDSKRLTIYQPANGELSVELKRLEIRFHVNQRGLLFCPQLKAEIDPQQDIGTLHGLRSLVTLRDTLNHERRSVIIPIGNIQWERDGIHVAVRISNEGVYAKYTLNSVLGRLDCPPEPLLLYLKAAIHALTSFPLPDDFIRNTGTEEARHCLLSARSQPWTPLAGFPQRMLSVIKSLSPKRTLYPPGINLYQKVRWDQHLTCTIQHEDLAPLVAMIERRSRELGVFSMTQTQQENVSYDDPSVAHLRMRGRIRRQLYERVCFDSDTKVLSQAAHTDVFIAHRDQKPFLKSCRVYQTIRAMMQSDISAFGLPKLAPILEKWNTFPGIKEFLSDIDLAASLEVGTPQLWGGLVRRLHEKDSTRTYDNHFSLALSAFNDDVDMIVIMWLVALSKSNRLSDIQPPNHTLFTNFRHFEEPSKDVFLSLVMPKSLNENQSGLVLKDDPKKEAVSRIASHILKMWPNPPVSRQEFELSVRGLKLNTKDLSLKKTWQKFYPELQRLKNNWELSVYLLDLESAADMLLGDQSKAEQSLYQSVWTLRPSNLRRREIEKSREYSTAQVSMMDLLSRHKIQDRPNTYSQSWLKQQSQSSARSHKSNTRSQISGLPVAQRPEYNTLQGIVQGLISSPLTSQRAYGEDLLVSLAALAGPQQSRKVIHSRPKMASVKREINRCLQCLREQQDKIEHSVSQGDDGFAWFSKGQLWPCFSPVAILEQLRNGNRLLVPYPLVNRIVEYGVLTTRLQRYLRIEDAILRRDDRWLEENLATEGHSNWDPLNYPEWLLLEIDSNILIRPIQIEVAHAITSPPSMFNSVLQMNMGQGKTSCIMPMAAILLADTTNLCRLVVPRALLLQTAQVMQSRLGGLVGREVCHLPFARRSPTDDQALDLYHSLHKSTLAAGGVMLCLPEHLLSFKLSGLQKLADKETKKAQKMMYIQAWLESSSRDVLDESDLTLSPKTQLIYPSGIPTMIDGHPQRWRLIEDMLSLVESHVPQLQAKFKDGIQVWRRHRGFPVIHLLCPEVEDRLNALLVDDVCHGRLSYVQFKADKSLTATKPVKLLLSTTQAPASIWEDAIASLNDEASVRKTLYLLHGLITQRLLILCLKKSWNVQYGLHPDRAPIAVPFEAKGIPSQTAEYGHPDTALVLTCLSFYHAGLSKSQLLQSLQLISNSEDPSSHYQRFASSRHLPDNLEHWHQLEMEDEAQVTLLWQYLRFEKHVVNHFLNNFAFPQHAKQFGVKFQASAWDIPLLSESMKRQVMTTGFSGTNDNKRILPRTIRQDDLPTLIQTNAEVLVHLLEPRNQKCFQAIDRHGRHLNEIGILELLRSNGIKILIDAGAQILEMENHQLAAAWLDVYTEAQGAVYFDKNGRIMVRARFQKSPVPLQASSFADNLHKCVVYIDEAHTRGTDLKLPVDAQGAVTLGIGSTKDQITQAAMRLRQLATTQSIAFVAPPEVYTSVLSLRSVHSPEITASHRLKSSDIVHWLLEQSCEASDNMMSLHIAQGFDFCRRTDALLEYRKSSQKKKNKDKLLQESQQSEGQTLEQLYGPKEKASSTGLRAIDSTRLQSFVKELQGLEVDLVKHQRRACSSAFDEVEQEREVEFEVHQLREKQNPTHLTALTFSGLDKSLVHFSDESEVELASLNFIPVLDLIGNTSIGLKYGVKGSSSNLFVSKEFSRTVQSKKTEASRRLMRPVEWVLWRPDIQTALVVIPEEAELLLPILRRIRTPTTFLLTYTSPFTRSLLEVGTLAYFPVPTPEKELVIPSWLSIEIGIMAGRLYLPYDQYTQLRSCLNVDETAEPLATMDDAHRSTKHILPNFGILNPQSLSKFLSEWISYRSRSSDITHTPMGYLIGNRDLPADHSFFTSHLKSRVTETRSLVDHEAPRKNAEAQSSDDESE
ncbi:very large low complexity protein [Fusarium bulbicola]|nr:very large low complexity protein [Fusarium bulbicola]